MSFTVKRQTRSKTWEVRRRKVNSSICKGDVSFKHLRHTHSFPVPASPRLPCLGYWVVAVELFAVSAIHPSLPYFAVSVVLVPIHSGNVAQIVQNVFSRQLCWDQVIAKRWNRQPRDDFALKRATDRVCPPHKYATRRSHRFGKPVKKAITNKLKNHPKTILSTHQ